MLTVAPVGGGKAGPSTRGALHRIPGPDWHLPPASAVAGCIPSPPATPLSRFRLVAASP